jgi:hypothetical protein
MACSFPGTGKKRTRLQIKRGGSARVVLATTRLRRIKDMRRSRRQDAGEHELEARAPDFLSDGFASV